VPAPPVPALPVDLGPGAPPGLATAATGPQEDIPAGVNPALNTPDAEEPAVAGLLRGVDVSSFQGVPAQWKAAAGTITWAAVKITELEPSGLHYVNPDAARDWSFLHRQEHVRVAYMFGHPSVSASASVAFFLQELRPLGLHDDDAIALDIEVTDGLSASAVDAWCVAVLEALEKQTGRTPIVYTFLNFAAEGNVSRLGKYPLWIADPSSPVGHPRVPAPWTTWTMHQYAITGNIDRDVAKFNSRADMSAHLGVPKEPVLKDLGGTITSSLASARWDSGVTVVAGIGKDGFIQVIRWANGKWGTWKDVSPSKALHPPALLVWGKETGHLYYTAANGHVVQISTQDAGQTWA
jgi:lysozyme